MSVETNDALNSHQIYTKSYLEKMQSKQVPLYKIMHDIYHFSQEN